MKQVNLLTAIVFLFFLTSCLNELDNYDSFNGGINGRILDAETGELIPMPFQGSTGAIINMWEQNTGATKSIDFYAKDDGTFANTQMFNCEYKITVNGPFVDKCEAMVNVNGQTSIDLKATPYSRITASATISGHIVTISYKVVPTNVSYNISEVYGYWNFAPGVDNGAANYAKKVTVKEKEGTIEFDLDKRDKENEKNVFELNQHKIKANGNKIYVRIGAKTEGAVNYSQTVIVTLQ